MSKFDPHDPDTWSPELRITVAALDEITDGDEASYLLGYVAGAVEGIAEAAGIDLDFSDLLDDAAARMVREGWTSDPGLMIEDAAETASDGGEL